MSAASTPSGQQLVLGDVSWRSYERLLRVFDDRHLRITYDRGALEIMTLSPEHERFKCLLSYLILVLVEELGWNMASFGSMTFKRKKKRRGLEPDECYWIQSEPMVRGKDKIDLRRDPPPDLVIEVNWTHSSLDRLAIFAALLVPEVLRFDGRTLRIHLLGSDVRYSESERSRVFPFLPMPELTRFVAMRSSLSETDIVRQVRAWVRERIAASRQV
jgi:Uma2 family endonuclease